LPDQPIRRRECSIVYWEIIADNLSKAGWSWGCVSAVDSEGRTIWIVDAHRDNGKRFVVCADEKLTTFSNLNRRFELSVHKIKTNHHPGQRFAASPG